MGQIQDLEQRITAAFARITAGVDRVVSQAATAPQPMPTDDLELALAEEQMANAQLHERLSLMTKRATETEQMLQAEVETLTRHLDAQGLDVQRLSGTVAQLREDLRRLREAAVQGVVDPGLINKAMMAELEALRATRAAEANEMHNILSALDPILQAEEARAHA